MSVAQADRATPAYKVERLRSAIVEHDLRTLVETGLYLGGGSGMGCLDLLDRYVVFDCQIENVVEAQQRLAGSGVDWNVNLGDSGEFLPVWLAYETEPALFWLDAHGIADDFPGFPDFPLLRELEAIRNWPAGACSIVLVDDFDMMGADGFIPLVGSPSPSELLEFVQALDLWTMSTVNGILELVPK